MGRNLKKDWGADNKEKESKKGFREYFEEGVLALKERELGIKIKDEDRKKVLNVINLNDHTLRYMDLAEIKGLGESGYRKMVIERKGRPLSEEETVKIERHRFNHKGLRGGGGYLLVDEEDKSIKEKMELENIEIKRVLGMSMSGGEIAA